ncbi:LysR family transcriptional regulator [Aliidongia dinghuensis]|uniref:LysR family transcriptional regulator n=1 Tax=Aliidongia dinghuensis TaxID=1867774 RepID=A0A8J3E1Q3_9PROT|nr:LysR family transcriptional regulator [Aliidongia dinghuensis]GGF01849.1 LysR family transcriptional regulator [Aliidongia dinghuensis]
MNATNIAAVDLNLLKAFEALLRERSVTRAAVSIGVSQPALSHSLTRLRHLFGDELFVRLPHGMEPTPKAHEIGILVEVALDRIRRALDLQHGFDPATTRRSFSATISEYAEVALIERLIRTMVERAPNADLRLMPLDVAAAPEQLDGGGVTLAIGHFRDQAPRFGRRLIYRDRLSGLVHCRHPVLAEPLTAERYVAWPHIVMSPSGKAIRAIDPHLAARGLKRRVAATVGTYLALPPVLRTTTMIATLPRITAEALLRHADDLVLIDLPFVQLIDVSMVWHVKTEVDPAERWFRDLVAEAARPLDSEIEAEGHGAAAADGSPGDDRG